MQRADSLEVLKQAVLLPVEHGEKLLPVSAVPSPNLGTVDLTMECDVLENDASKNLEIAGPSAPESKFKCNDCSHELNTKEELTLHEPDCHAKRGKPI